MNKFDPQVPLDEIPREDLIESYDVKGWLADHYQTILTALTQAAEIERGDKVVVDGWKPMSHTPRLGQWYFVNVPKYYNSEFVRYITVIAFADGIDEQGIFWISDQDGERVEPTHWMPLPQPPASEGKDDE